MSLQEKQQEPETVDASCLNGKNNYNKVQNVIT